MLLKTAATRWKKSGMAIDDISRQLGHMKENGRPNIEQTMTYLADTPSEELTKIVAAAMYRPKPQIVNADETAAHLLTSSSGSGVARSIHLAQSSIPA